MKLLKIKTMKPSFNIIYIFCALSIISFESCKKWVEVDPPIQSIVGKEIYNTNSGAASVLTGIYRTMIQGSFIQGMNGISLRAGLSADELTLDAGNLDPDLENLYKNTLDKNLGGIFWGDLYSYVFRVNAAIEGINSAKDLSADVKKQLLGEAKFIRAFCYFYLVNLYGDVPLLISTDFKVNSVAPRADKALVYQQMIADLLDAQGALSDNYVGDDARSVTTERVRPCKAAATALLARVYLYNKQWDKAETEASAVINNGNFSLIPLEEVFLLNSKETIWSLQIINTAYNQDGMLFNLQTADNGPNPGSGRPVYLSEQLAGAFEPGDNRKSKWVGAITANVTSYPFANKYKTDLSMFGSTTVTEYPMVLRLAEQYLIRAEARAQQGKLMGANTAESDLNTIRARAGLGGTSATSQADMLAAILAERRVELFTEWGNRWFDLKRTNEIDNVMPSICIIKGGAWAPSEALYPIPIGDIKSNPSLRGHQNPGYPEQ
jgi:hypothetical protein